MLAEAKKEMRVECKMMFVYSVLNVGGKIKFYMLLNQDVKL